MRRMFTTLTLGLVLATGPNAQQGLTGQWRTDSGLRAALNLVATEAIVTGTFTVRDRVMTIEEGSISNDTLRFKAALEDRPEGFTGTLAGDEITLWRDRNGKSDPIVLRRVSQAGSASERAVP